MKISAEQYAQVLYGLTEGKDSQAVDGVVLKFAEELSANNHLNLLDNVIEKFNKIWNERNGIVEAEVVSAEKLDDELIKKIKSFIAKKYSARQVIFNNKIDRNIKGGIIIKVGDEVIDGSVAGWLRELKTELLKV